MGLIEFVIVVAVIGVVVWLITTYIPMDPTIKRVIQIVAAVVVIMWALRLMGLLPFGGDIPMRQVP